MLQGSLVDLVTCLLSQRLSLTKDIVGKFAKEDQEDKIKV